MIKFIKNLFKNRKQQCNIPVVRKRSFDFKNFERLTSNIEPEYKYNMCLEF